MFELISRVLFATTVLLVSGFTGEPPFETAWRAAAFFSTYSFFGYAMERRGVRNAGVSGLFAVADSAVVAILLASTGRMETFGFLTLIPPAYAALRYGSDAMAMAPITAGWMLIGANMFDGKGWTPVLLAQTLGVLTVGLLGGKRTQWIKVKELIEVPIQGAVDVPLPQDVFDLREKFRVLRDHTTEVERKGRRDRIIVQLAEAQESDTESGLIAIGKKLQELLRVDGLTIHVFSQEADKLVVQTVAGSVPIAIRDAAFSMPDFFGEWQLKDRLEASMAALRAPDEAAHSSTLILKDRGRIIGVLSLYDATKQRIADALEVGATVSEAIARIIRAHSSKESERKRLRQAELLYQVAGLCQGSDSPASLAGRVSRELWETVHLDHLSICFVAEGESSLAALQGVNMKVLDALNFASGTGLDAWTADGAPEVVLLNAREDRQLSRVDALKMRIGSFVLIPISFEETAYGYLTAATNRVHGIDAQSLEILRLVGAELSQALGRIENGHQDPAGLTTPTEFHQIVTTAGTGFLVYLDVLRRDDLVEIHGKAAVEFVARKLAGKLRTLLPSGGLLCRRPEGDFVAFIRTSEESFARKWATNAAATASLLALNSPDGQTRIPMAIKSKVAKIAQQSNQISGEVAHV